MMRSRPLGMTENSLPAVRRLAAIGYSCACWAAVLAILLPAAVTSFVQGQGGKPGAGAIGSGKEKKDDKTKDVRSKDAKGGKKSSTTNTDVRKDDFSVRGVFSRSDKKYPRRSGSYFHEFKVEMDPAKQYCIELIDPNPHRRIDPYLYVESSTGDLLASDDDGGYQTNSRLIFRPRAKETYKIIATTFGGGQTGDFMLIVRPFSLRDGAPPLITVSLPQLPVWMPRREHATIPARFDDITVTPLAPMGMPESRGNGHGYVEHRFQVENRSEDTDHVVTLTMPRYNFNSRGGGGAFLSSLSKTVRVGAATAMKVSLFQPDLMMPSHGGVKITIDGEAQEDGVAYNGVGERGERYVSRFRHMVKPSGSSELVPILTHNSLRDKFHRSIKIDAVPIITGTRGSPTASSYGFQEADGIKGWSNHWLGYTSFDGIAMPAAELESAPPEIRSAIWQFTESGGSLFILGKCPLPKSWQRNHEKLKDMDIYFPGFGQCVVRANEGATWDDDDWKKVTDMWDASARPWHTIQSPSDANTQFTVVEGIGAIPVRGLLVFMLCFVVVIGPVNFYWLSRTGRRMWLLWTVPVFSFFTCLMLFGYMILSEGWYPHVRVEGVTVLDEVNQRAASVGWLGYYSPVSIGGGLHFDNDTELTPHFVTHSRRYNDAAKQCTIDWTTDQHLQSGWVDAKIPSHFLVRRNEKRLERIQITSESGKAPVLINSLGTDIKSIWVADLSGKVYEANNITAGESVSLTVTGKTIAPNADALRKVFRGDWTRAVGSMESKHGDYLRPGCYLAIVEDAPFFQTGVRHTQSRKERSIVFGIMKTPF